MSLVSRLAAHLGDRNALMSPSKLPLPGQRQNARHQIVLIDGFRLEHEMPRFDAGQIENIVD
jgi:hypothetical protein